MGTSTATLAICLSVWGYLPAGEVSEESVDLIEINHFHDAEGRPVFDQVLFYDWSAAEARYQVRDWRLVKSSNQIPVPSARDREFHSVWNDFKSRDAVRATKARVVRETWTQYDPELVEREFLPENKRRKLQDIATPRRGMPRPESAAGSSAPAATPPRDRPSDASRLRPLQAPSPAHR